MATLLAELRNLGHEIYFAGVRLPCRTGLGISDEEKAFLEQFIDYWVADFEWEGGIPLQLQRISQKTSRRIRLMLNRHDSRSRPTGNFLLDEWFDSRWLGLACDIQKQFNFSRVLVPYVFSSAFFRAFPAPCLKILDCHDVFSNRNDMIARSGLVDKRSWWFSVSTADERRALNRADVVLGIQDKESEFFRSLINNSRPVYTVSHFASLKPTAFREDCLKCIGFLGTDILINAQALRWFLEDVWPHVVSVVPEAKLVVAGSICSSLHIEDSIISLGEVSDLNIFYSQIMLSIAPMRAGTGLKIKTIEAMSYGRMVISTSIGCEGLECYEGKGIAVSRSESEYAHLLITRLLSPEIAIQEGRLAETSVRDITLRSKHALSMAMTMSGEHQP